MRVSKCELLRLVPAVFGSLKFCLLVLVVLHCGHSASHAGTFNTDFNTGLPTGVNVFGVAKVEADATGGTNTTGVLKLTEANVGSSSGGAILDDLDPGATVSGFEANFSLHIGRGNGADGASFFFGDFADAAYSEEGPGNIQGLTVAFDIFNNATGGGVPEAQAIDVKWNNVILAHRLIGAASATTGAQPIGSLNAIRTQTTANGISLYRAVKIRVETDGRFSLVFNNTVVYTNLPIFRPITNATINPTSGPRFGFGARTGGSHDDHWIDNLQITTFTAPSPGQPHALSISQIALASPTAGAPASALGGAIVRLQDSIFSVNTNAVRMTFNNAAVTPTVTRAKSSPDLTADDLTVIAYMGPNNILPAGIANVTVSYVTTSTPGLSNSYSYSFVVQAVTPLPASYAVTGADLSKPGFKARVYQMARPRSPGDQNVTPTGERQVNRGFRDPVTGQPEADTSDFASDPSPLDPEGYVDIPGTVNFDQAGANRGSITGASNPPRQEEFFPGLSQGGDNFSLEFITYVHLPAGGYRFGLLADDRFRFAFGPAPHAAGIPILAASTGASQQTFVDVLVAQEGFYPLRVSYWEGGGDAHIELFYVEPGTERRILLNDPELPTIKTYREATNSRPRISRVLPVEGYYPASPDENVLIEMIDGGIAVNDSSIAMAINGAAQTITKAKTGKITTITRTGSVDNLLPSGLNTVALIYSFSENSSTVTVTNTYSFSVAPYYNPLPASIKVPAGTINTAETGFNVRYHQLDRLKTAPNDQAGQGRLGPQGNQMPHAEIQINGGELNVTNGLPYPNIADPGPNGNYTASMEKINFNITFAAPGTYGNANSGFITAAAPPAPLPGATAEDSPPGLPSPTYDPANGTAAGNLNPSNGGIDNYVAEFTTYLDLKRGAHLFAFNSDDGFVATAGPDPRDSLGALLGFFTGGRGNRADVLGQEFFPWFNGVAGGAEPAAYFPRSGIWRERVQCHCSGGRYLSVPDSLLAGWRRH